MWAVLCLLTQKGCCWKVFKLCIEFYHVTSAGLWVGLASPFRPEHYKRELDTPLTTILVLEFLEAGSITVDYSV